MTNILIIEDEPAIAALLTLHLRELPSQVAICNQGWQGLDEAVKGRYDFLILDVMLPGLNGLEICRRLRQQLPFLPILMLTSCSDDQDKIAGLELGADDYVTKPFHAGELLARVRSILRRTRGERRRLEQQADYLERGELQMDVPLRCVRKRGLKIDLTVREFDLLQLFMQHPGRPFSRPEILDAVWGEQFEGLEHTVNSHINRLRSKIEDDLVQPHYILTAWGIGYQFNEEA
ncbi:MAG: response regulator transcription factor [Saprospiraceae bacterium]|nr:response regulator transcription factor [Saprospiraceae bacterium]